MDNQTELFNKPSGGELRDQGIKRAVDHAEKVKPDWLDNAYSVFLKWLEKKGPDEAFMIEDFRLERLVPEPPHNRAFGAISVRAVKEGRIWRFGYHGVRSPRGHTGIVSLWKKKS